LGAELAVDDGLLPADDRPPVLGVGRGGREQQDDGDEQDGQPGQTHAHGNHLGAGERDGVEVDYQDSYGPEQCSARYTTGPRGPLLCWEKEGGRDDLFLFLIAGGRAGYNTYVARPRGRPRPGQPDQTVNPRGRMNRELMELVLPRMARRLNRQL